jgi:hypothetical protein
MLRQRASGGFMIDFIPAPEAAETYERSYFCSLLTAR